MKTAVSLPDDLFRHAEITAKRLRLSRSKLYAQALEDFLARSTSESVTDRLNVVYSEARVEVDPGIQHASKSFAAGGVVNTGLEIHSGEFWWARDLGGESKFVPSAHSSRQAGN